MRYGATRQFFGILIGIPAGKWPRVAREDRHESFAYSACEGCAALAWPTMASCRHQAATASGPRLAHRYSATAPSVDYAWAGRLRIPRYSYFQASRRDRAVSAAIGGGQAAHRI